MTTRYETLAIINALDKKNDEPEKMSILSSDSNFTIYKNHRLARASLAELQNIVKLNHSLLTEDRTKYDLIAEHLLNKLNKKQKPFPDVKELPRSQPEAVVPT